MYYRLDKGPNLDLPWSNVISAILKNNNIKASEILGEFASKNYHYIKVKMPSKKL